MGGIEIGLLARNRRMTPDPTRMGDPYNEIRIGTHPDGSFIITNVPAPVEWYLYGKVESVAARGATALIECATKRDNESIDLGDIQIKPCHRLRGRVVLSDGKPIPDGMRMTIGSDRTFDSQTAMLAADGRFEFGGLRSDSYSVFASVKG